MRVPFLINGWWKINKMMAFVWSSYDSWDEEEDDDGGVVQEIIDSIPHHTDTFLCQGHRRRTSHNFVLD